MKKIILICTRVVPVTLALVLGFTACSRRPAFQTVLPRTAGGVSDEGPTNQSGNRTVRANDGIGNASPIPQGGFDPGRNGVGPISNPIAIDPNGTPGPDDDLRDKFKNATRNEGKFASETVYFDLDKSNVKEGEIGKIRTVAQHLNANKTDLMEIEGHCDERGTEEYNRSLGERRAQAIRDFLVREGVDSNRITTISYGEDRPADPGHGEAAWSKNRRGTFILLLPK